MTHQLSRPSPTRPELAELLRKAKGYVMTPAEVAAQRKSWVVGETMLQHPDMTRDEAVKLYEEVCG